MKAFFEEYGFIIVTVVVMIALVTLVGDEKSGLVSSIKQQTDTAISSLTPDYSKLTSGNEE